MYGSLIGVFSFVALPVSAWIEILKIWKLRQRRFVALPVSAWIEISWYTTHHLMQLGRTPRECVDWNYQNVRYRKTINCRTPRECVDWNEMRLTTFREITGRTPRECVDWNLEVWFWIVKTSCRTPRECVDWNLFSFWANSSTDSRTPRECVDWNNCFHIYHHVISFVALPVSAWIEMEIIIW